MHFEKIKYLAIGSIISVPVLAEKLLHRGTGGTINARYCYSVWLRHLVHAANTHISTCPTVVAELGPGDSIGSGLAALLSGSDKYFALDVMKFWDKARVLEIYESLIELFKEKAPIPDNEEFPGVFPELNDYSFPSHIITDEVLAKALNPSRLQAIREDIEKLESSNQTEHISFFIPWSDEQVIQEGLIDLAFSQAVFQYIPDLHHTYYSLYQWLKPGGLMSHQMSFTAHRTATRWNGHWTYSKREWKVINGRRKYMLNRKAYSDHLKVIDQLPFKVTINMPHQKPTMIDRKELAASFKHLTEQDLNTEGMFLQAVKDQ